MQVVSEDEDEDDDFEEPEEEEAPKKRTNRAAVLKYVTSTMSFDIPDSRPFLHSKTTAAKKAPAKKAAASSSKQATLSFAPSGRGTRAAATRAKKKVTEIVSVRRSPFSKQDADSKRRRRLAMRMIDQQRRFLYTYTRILLEDFLSSLLAVFCCYCYRHFMFYHTHMIGL